MATKRPLDSFALRDIFQDIEKDLIASMKRNLAKHTAEEQALGFSWEQWQKAKLRAIGAYRVANRLILNEYKPDIQNAIDTVLKESYSQAYNNSIKLADDIDLMFSGMDRIGVLGQVPPDESNFFRINDPKLSTMIQEMQRDFSNTDGLVLRKMDDVYRQTITKSALELTTGSTSIQSAIDHATKDFLAKGIDCINYKNGSRVNIASYAEMYLRTASSKAGLLADGKARDEYGVYTVLSSVHVNCCEHCLSWQGKVMIDDEFTSLSAAQAQEISRATGYPLLSIAMKDHFLHPNCRHSLSTYYPGQSTLPKALTQEQADKALENYNLEQQQRKLESELRKWKRIREGSMSPEQLITSDRMVKSYQQRLRDHIKEHPDFRRNYWRERMVEKSSDQVYNSGSKSSLKEAFELYEKEPFLQKSVSVVKNGTFIPAGSVFETGSVKPIAGPGTDKPIIDIDRLVKNYGGTAEDWVKKVGKIKSSEGYYDIHWYEKELIQYEHKVKVSVKKEVPKWKK